MFSNKQRCKRIGIVAIGVLATVIDVPLPSPSTAVSTIPVAEAVVGRPLTPMSGAGMARRTSRRTARRTSQRYAGYGAYGAATVGMVYSLPGGCVHTTIGGIPYYDCQGTYYRPMQDGPDTVYVIEAPEEK